MVYVDAVPVRVDSIGEVTHIGLLLRAMADGTISRALVTGRVVFGERIRHALLRHLEKDLGPMALPASRRIRHHSPLPNTSRTRRSPATTTLVSMQSAWRTSSRSTARRLLPPMRSTWWVTPEEAMSPEVIAEMTGGHDRLLRLALGHTGQLP